MQAAPKKRPQRPPARVEEITPKTFRDQVVAKLQDWLKTAGQARTHSLKLQSLEFADELAKKLLSHAVVMEKAYLRMTDALKEKDTTEEDFEIILLKMDKKLEVHAQLQAFIQGLGTFSVYV